MNTFEDGVATTPPAATLAALGSEGRSIQSDVGVELKGVRWS
jgi:hypothetical protein